MEPHFTTFVAIPSPFTMGFVLLIVLVIAAEMILVTRYYKRCPAGKALVITGKTKMGRPEIIRSGAVFVWPLLQQCDYLDLQPMTVEIDGGTTPIKATATVVVGTSAECLDNAVSHLVGLSSDQIREHAGNIIRGQLFQSYAKAGRNVDASELALSAQAACVEPLQHLGLELLGLVMHDGDGR